MILPLLLACGGDQPEFRCLEREEFWARYAFDGAYSDATIAEMCPESAYNPCRAAACLELWEAGEVGACKDWIWYEPWCPYAGGDE